MRCFICNKIIEEHDEGWQHIDQFGGIDGDANEDHTPTANDEEEDEDEDDEDE